MLFGQLIRNMIRKDNVKYSNYTKVIHWNSSQAAPSVRSPLASTALYNYVSLITSPHTPPLFDHTVGALKAHRYLKCCPYHLTSWSYIVGPPRHIDNYLNVENGRAEPIYSYNLSNWTIWTYLPCVVVHVLSLSVGDKVASIKCWSEI